jgi:hypothetical protein
MHNTYKRFADDFQNIISNRDDIYLAFISGSIPKNSQTSFSDIDVWIIFREESALNYSLHAIPELFGKSVEIEHISISTPTHFFVFTKDKLQIDLNLSTAAAYHSILSPSKNVLVDFSPTNLTKGASSQINYYKAVKTLERTVSKFLSRQEFVVPRFLSGLRDESLLPLLGTYFENKVPTIIQVNLKDFPAPVRLHLKRTFVRPDRESCREGILSAVWLLEYLARHFDVGTKDTVVDLKKIKQTVRTSEAKGKARGK